MKPMEYWMGEQVLVTKAETPQQFYHEHLPGATKANKSSCTCMHLCGSMAEDNPLLVHFQLRLMAKSNDGKKSIW